MKKRPTLYLLIICSWLAIVLLFLPDFLAPIKTTTGLLHVFVIISTAFILYFWLNGLKDVVYTFYFHLRKPQLPKPKPAPVIFPYPRVELVYLSCNDFEPIALSKSMQQDYPNFSVVICDDSTKPEHTQQIDAFVASHQNVTVVRRLTNKGYKAGNLNNWLKGSTADFYVILDSDEVIPSNFITSCIDYFHAFSDIGIVQANHVVRSIPNNFVKTFSRGVESHWATYQAVKNNYGFLSFLGHGAMISAACYQAVGEFPEVVAEDLCFTIRARELGYYTCFAPEIVCEEEYPISYLSFKKRHNKWTQGNMEFIKKYSLRILFSKLTWFEKLDIFLFTYNLPLTAFFVLYIIINIVIFPLYGYSTNYSTMLMYPTVLFLLAPMLNDIIFYRRKTKNWILFVYCTYVLSLYGSMLFISLQASLFSLFGKSVFLVTPKTTGHISYWEAVKTNLGEIVFALALGGISLVLLHSLLPVFLIITPALQSVALTLMSNETVDP